MTITFHPIGSGSLLARTSPISGFRLPRLALVDGATRTVLLAALTESGDTVQLFTVDDSQATIGPGFGRSFVDALTVTRSFVGFSSYDVPSGATRSFLRAVR